MITVRSIARFDHKALDGTDYYIVNIDDLVGME